MAILEVVTGAGQVELPAPVTISAGSEIIWSSNTGRSSTGKMLGDVIAEKETLSINWGILTLQEYETIKTNLRAGFFSLKVNISGTPITLSRYRGTLNYEPLGKLGDGKYYYRSVSVDIIEQ